MTERKPAGITLVEVLVVVLVVALLLLLLFPALHKARAAARRNQCQANVTALSKAIKSYADAHQVLPAGVADAVGPVRNVADGFHHGWLVQVLPFIKGGEFYTQFNIACSVYAAENATVRQTRVRSFFCPEEPRFRAYNTAVGASFTNYAGCHHGVEAPIDAGNDGLLFLNSAIGDRDIPDGRAYTLLIGEVMVDPSTFGWASGTRATLRNTGSRLNAVTAEALRESLTAPGDPRWVGGFSSRHAGGVHLGYADGAVRFVDQEIDPIVLSRLGKRNDEPAGAMNGK